MDLLRRIVFSLALAFGFATSASASSSSPDFTDLWWNPAESGWGFNLIQQGNTLFGTLFVYGSDNSARWFVADAMVLQDATAGTFRFSSRLYQVTGPYFAALSFNPATVAATDVGTAEVIFSSSTAGTLVYRVGTDVVTKQIQRQTFRTNNPVGSFQGGFSANASACTDSTNNGPAGLAGNMTTTVTGSTVTFRVESFQGFVCSFAGNYAQQGRLATVSNGTWNCVQNGQTFITGTFTLTDVDVQVNGFTATFNAVDNLCTYTGGRFGGIRLVGN